MARPTIYEYAGGAPAFLALAAAHHERCLQDPVLSHPFSHDGDPDHLAHLATYWAEVFGGPPTYSESLGGQSRMMTMHSSTGADADLGDRFVAAFVQAIDDAGLPADGEFRAALGAYMRWAVDVVRAVSPEGSVVAEGLPVPHWSWDGLVDRT
jgi:hemoglobin